MLTAAPQQLKRNHFVEGVLTDWCGARTNHRTYTSDWLWSVKPCVTAVCAERVCGAAHSPVDRSVELFLGAVNR